MDDLQVLTGCANCPALELCHLEPAQDTDSRGATSTLPSGESIEDAPVMTPSIHLFVCKGTSLISFCFFQILMMGWWPLVGPCRRWSKVPRTTYMFVHSMHDHELSGLCPAIVFLAAIICSIFHAMSCLLVKNKPLPYQFALCARTFSQKHLTNSAAVTSVQTAQRLRNAATHGHRHADTCSGYPAAQKGAAPLSVFFPNWFADPQKVH